MKTIQDMLGIEKIVVETIARELGKRGLNEANLSKLINQHTESVEADVYENMRGISHITYRLVELETQIANLTQLVKVLNKRG